MAFPLQMGEWPYKDIGPCIIVESYLENSENDLIDYKIHCFDGRPEFIQVIFGRHLDSTQQCFFNKDWIKQPFVYTIKYERYEGEIPKPENFKLMMEIARKLSRGFIYIRVDLYNINGRIVFGELTHHPGSGTDRFNLPEWDFKLGQMIDLSKFL
jgi:hypothetical protein